MAVILEKICLGAISQIKYFIFLNSQFSAIPVNNNASIGLAQGVKLSEISLSVGSQRVNSSPPCAAYMRQWLRSALVQIKACRLFGAKPLPKPMLGYCQVDPCEQTSWNFNTLQTFPFTKMHLEILSAKWRPFCPGGDELTNNEQKTWTIDKAANWHIYGPKSPIC